MCYGGNNKLLLIDYTFGFSSITYKPTGIFGNINLELHAYPDCAQPELPLLVLVVKCIPMHVDCDLAEATTRIKRDKYINLSKLRCL